ncbi:DUF72 domain-containing protein [Mucilaginibacter sp. L3T2-6]|uniref:DUF72 domain-containing protein n=1 Tax=Mucilaginibacter sp. L3T2-6 TaxID=3062491 RepID=UPI0026746D7C|nr:DUF72 domain-containing protein [Mucilaginibacter sp. L3T2-6]MDO3643218.1 DUF72 domain-containing protein [Mucilaginibacter sp. L3T2-6]MDV6215542.1 DUF72 domain-containing protein [Mucilaginibacter sp. L3T2-6]
MEWHIGCSGFHYKHWKGSFYPDGLPQRRWFEFYAEHFSTLELNVTFYRFPRLSFLQNWHRISPPGFRFSVKAPRAITHFKQFHNVADMMTSFYATISDGLGDKLGPVLFQLPPRLKYDETRLQRILETLDPGFNNVLEFRHPSWWQDTVYKSLAKRGVTFCGMSHPELPDLAVRNTPVVYYRFHGVPDLYSSSYSDETLRNVASQLKQDRNLQSAWLYFNNDAAMAAIPNAKTLIRLAGND